MGVRAVNDALETGIIPQGALQSLGNRLIADTRAANLDLAGHAGLLSALVRRIVERVLEVELGYHLGYGRHAVVGRGTGNSRNGSTNKTLRTDLGRITIHVPRDRVGSFSPQLVPKHARQVIGFGETVLSLYARPRTVPEIERHLWLLYAPETERGLVWKVATKLHPIVTAWRDRPLHLVYPVVLIDSVMVQGHTGGLGGEQIAFAVGIGVDGGAELLALWEFAREEDPLLRFKEMLADLRRRGLTNVGVFCCAPAYELPAALAESWPHAIVQTSVTELVRHTLHFASQEDPRSRLAASLDAVSRPADFRPAPWRSAAPRGREPVLSDERNQRTCWPAFFNSHVRGADAGKPMPQQRVASG